MQDRRDLASRCWRRLSSTALLALVGFGDNVKEISGARPPHAAVRSIGRAIQEERTSIESIAELAIEHAFPQSIQNVALKFRMRISLLTELKGQSDWIGGKRRIEAASVKNETRVAFILTCERSLALDVEWSEGTVQFG
jgi:hypothetical protein